MCVHHEFLWFVPTYDVARDYWGESGERKMKKNIRWGGGGVDVGGEVGVVNPKNLSIFCNIFAKSEQKHSVTLA